MASKLVPIHRGKSGTLCKELQGATGRRLRARDLDTYAPDVDGHCGPQTIEGVAKAAWALGAQKKTLKDLRKTGEITVGVQRMIRNPGKRTPEQKKIGVDRMTRLVRDRKSREKAETNTGRGRTEVVRLGLLAGRNYAANPGAYHYLAGGKANTVFLKPTPHDWRSDCSQFASSVQLAAGLPALGVNGPLWVSTYSMAAYLKEVRTPSPGDFGMYGTRNAPHHVEVYLGSLGGPGHEFMGHGSPPIDSLTPGRPDFYLRNPLSV